MPPQDRALNPLLAITWEEHRRTRELCDWFGFPLHVLSYDIGGFRRYLRLAIATMSLLFRTRPKVVLLQIPSGALALLVVLLRPFCGRYRIIMDAHNEAIEPFAYTRWPVPLLYRFCLRRADAVIVTNSALETSIIDFGGQPHVLPDRLPGTPIAAPAHVPMSKPFRVMVVATYAADEPIAEIIEAARLLGPDYGFSITGRATKLADAERARLPANVHQTGFLSEHDYWLLMASSHAMLDFSLKPNCLVCGAYEALALKRPMILSNNPATIALFGRVAVIARTHSPEDIAESIRESSRRYDELGSAAEGEQANFLAQWNRQAHALKDIINRWLTSEGAARAPELNRQKSSY